MTTITNLGVETAARLVANVSPVSPFSYIGTGSGSSAESPSSTALDAENTLYGSQRAAATCSFTAPGSIQWMKLFTFSGSVTIREVGIFNASEAGDMFLRLLLTLNKNYLEGESVQIIVTVNFSRV